MADNRSHTKALAAIAGATGGSTIGGSPVSVTNPMPVQQSVGGAAATATNPTPVQLSQGNVAASAANPVPVQPSIGGATVSTANPIPIKETITTTPVVGAGRVVAAAAAAVIADTGALAAGSYRVDVQMGGAGVAGAGKGMSFQHRNAANTANVTEGPVCAINDSLAFVLPKMVVALNERFRVVMDAVAAAAAEPVAARITATPI